MCYGLHKEVKRVSKLRDKTRRYSTNEDEYRHPLHSPYRRPSTKDWQRLAEDDSDSERDGTGQDVVDGSESDSVDDL